MRSACATSLVIELFTKAPISQGIAVIGLTDKYGSGGVERHIKRLPYMVCFDLLDGADFLACAVKRPKPVMVGLKPKEFTHDEVTGALLLRMDGMGLPMAEINN